MKKVRITVTDFRSQKNWPRFNNDDKYFRVDSAVNTLELIVGDFVNMDTINSLLMQSGVTVTLKKISNDE